MDIANLLKKGDACPYGEVIPVGVEKEAPPNGRARIELGTCSSALRNAWALYRQGRVSQDIQKNRGRTNADGIV